MELHPFLDPSSQPQPGLWYVLSAAGEPPSMRVGHTCCYLPPEGVEGASAGPGGDLAITGGKIYVIGGANPSGPFAEIHVLDTETMTWEQVDASGMHARYEHAVFSPSSSPHLIYIFGGAHQAGNLNSIQVFNSRTSTWNNLKPKGTPPSPRTYHTSTACLGDRFYVYSGGHAGADPVGDRQVHVYSAAENSWDVLRVRGDPPKPRHGHVVIAHGDRLYLHGGMSGSTFYDDLHTICLKTCTWTHVKQKKNKPCARAAHGGVAYASTIYLFGGMCKDGALDDLYAWHIPTNQWERVKLDGPSPACRLDFGICVLSLRVGDQPSAGEQDLAISGKQTKEVLDAQFARLSSAGSRSQPGSAGSSRSANSAGSARGDVYELSTEMAAAHLSGGHSPQQLHSYSTTPPDGRTPPAQHSPGGTPPSCDVMPGIQPLALGGAALGMAGFGGVSPRQPDPSARSVSTLLMVLGGMDTAGEVFDDGLLFQLELNANEDCLP